MAEHKVTVFAAANFETLAQEMAQGRGEHLASLATLMGVPANQQDEFFAMTQDHYIALLREESETSPVAMVTALKDAMATHPVLAKVSFPADPGTLGLRYESWSPVRDCSSTLAISCCDIVECGGQHSICDGGRCSQSLSCRVSGQRTPI